MKKVHHKTFIKPNFLKIKIQNRTKARVFQNIKVFQLLQIKQWSKFEEGPAIFQYLILHNFISNNIQHSSS